jgi:GMP synthase-like glutamine amidotransferase
VFPDRTWPKLPWHGLLQGYCLRVWQALLGEPGDTWQRFWAPKGELPTAHDVAVADLMVITGSHYSAYEPLPWIDAMAAAMPEWVHASGTCAPSAT